MIHKKFHVLFSWKIILKHLQTLAFYLLTLKALCKIVADDILNLHYFSVQMILMNCRLISYEKYKKKKIKMSFASVVISTLRVNTDEWRKSSSTWNTVR